MVKDSNPAQSINFSANFQELGSWEGLLYLWCCDIYTGTADNSRSMSFIKHSYPKGAKWSIDQNTGNLILINPPETQVLFESVGKSPSNLLRHFCNYWTSFDETSIF